MFFTRIPLPERLAAWVGYSAELLNGAARYFPLVGLLVGLLGAATYVGALEFFTPMIAVVLSMVVTVLVTGAFHEDGFADVCDGFGGTSDPARVLEIMKDSRIGAFGTIGIALMLLTKYSALLSLAENVQPELVGWMLVIGHALSRVAPVLLIRLLRYVRAEGDAKAKPLAENISTPGLVIALVCGVLPLFGLAYFFENSWLVLLGILPMLLVTWLMATWFVHRIGGYTGDCLGAVQQVSEVVFYLYAVALLVSPNPAAAPV